MTEPVLATADLGPRVAVFTARVNGRPIGVVNHMARHDDEMRRQAMNSLLAVGFDARQIMGVLNGVRG